VARRAAKGRRARAGSARCSPCYDCSAPDSRPLTTTTGQDA
jgi:hypothetical protein